MLGAWRWPMRAQNGRGGDASPVRPERNVPMTLLLVMVLEVSVAMAIGFILGRIWQIRCDLEQQRAGGFTAPPIARIPRP
jgi:hypothetical protein